jgi:hypothetical protein
MWFIGGPGALRCLASMAQSNRGDALAAALAALGSALDCGHSGFRRGSTGHFWPDVTRSLINFDEAVARTVCINAQGGAATVDAMPRNKYLSKKWQLSAPWGTSGQLHICEVITTGSDKWRKVLVSI